MQYNVVATAKKMTAMYRQLIAVFISTKVTVNMKVGGHIPEQMEVWVKKFLKRPTNIAKVIVKGKRMNKGAGYDLELRCVYEFRADRFSCD